MNSNQRKKIERQYGVELTVSSQRDPSGLRAVVIDGRGDAVVDADLISRLPAYNSLGLYNATLAQGGWDAIALNPHIEKLTTIGVTLPARMFSACAAPLAMKWIYVATKHLTASACAGIAQFGALQHLSLVGVRTFGSSLEFIHQLTRLSELHLNCSAIRDDGLEAISRMTWLRDLQLEGTKISRRALAELSRFTQLEKLGIQNNDQLDWRCLEELAGQQSLREIAIGFALPPESWPLLKSLPSLAILFVGGSLSADEHEKLSAYLGDVLIE